MKKLAYIIFAFLLNIGSSNAYAAVIPTPGKTNATGTDRPTQIRFTSLNDNLADLWSTAWRYLALVGVVAMIALLIASINYALAQGDPAKTTKARTAIVQILLAIALIVAGSMIISIIWAVVRAFAGGLA